jgi:hypothetical protein
MALIALWSCGGMATLFHGPEPEEAVPTFTITFDANEATGAAPSPQTVNRGTVITMPAEGGLTKGNNEFTGWNLSKSGVGTTSYPPKSPYTVTADQTFYAQWTDPAQVYTVTYQANGAGGTPPGVQKVVQGGSISVADKGNLTNGNKTFDGWNIQADGSGSRYTAGATLAVTGNTTLYAQWVDPSVQRYTVTYHANGASGTAPSAQTVNEGSNITLPGAGGLTNSGKTFNGWNTAANSSGTAYAEGAAYTVTANTSFYAQWISAPITPPGATLSEKFAYIANRTDDGVVYDIEVMQNEYLSPQTVSTQGRNVTITIRSVTPEDVKSIQINNGGTLFSVDNNITLTLRDIVIQGSAFNNNGLIKVGTGGILKVENGAKITGNTNNTSSSSGEGGGVFVNGGTLILNGGEITNNSCKINGGGVMVANKGVFEMYSGKLSNNEAQDAAGGAVFITGSSSFTMYGGEISGNTAKTWAGGVFCETGSVFKKIAYAGNPSSGIIYGSTAGNGIANTANSGAAVHCRTKYRDRTLGTFDEISNLNLNVGWD